MLSNKNVPVEKVITVTYNGVVDELIVLSQAVVVKKHFMFPEFSLVTEVTDSVRKCTILYNYIYEDIYTLSCMLSSVRIAVQARAAGIS